MARGIYYVIKRALLECFLLLYGFLNTVVAVAACQCGGRMCNEGEYCYSWTEDTPQGPMYYHECDSCGTGYVPASTCDVCVLSDSYCPLSEYAINCPSGVGLEGKRCKQVALGDIGCPVGGNCIGYKACDPSNGNTENIVMGECHFEGHNCYSNTMPCSSFPIGDGCLCAQSAQTGNARWIPSQQKWNTASCRCDVSDKEMSDCKSLNLKYMVKNGDSYVGTVGAYIKYSIEREYCKECHAGYVLRAVSSPNEDGVYTRPDNGNWGVITCDIQVRAPYYADGCVINFDLSAGDAAQNACRKQCPTGFETKSDGATNVGECQYDGHTTYTDDTGTFYIGSLDDCP